MAQWVTVWREFYRRQKQQHLAHLEPATWSNAEQVEKAARLAREMERRMTLKSAI